MKNHINLYQDRFRPKRELVTFPNTVLLVAVVLVLSLAVGGYVHYGNIDLKNKAQQQRMQLANLQEQKKTLERKVAALTPDRALTRRKAHLIEDIEGKTALLANLGQTRNFADDGFSNLLLDMANLLDKDIWLSQIYANKAQLSIAGFSMQSNAIPRWLDQFPKGAYVVGFETAMVSVERTPKGLYSFNVIGGFEGAEIDMLEQVMGTVNSSNGSSAGQQGAE